MLKASLWVVAVTMVAASDNISKGTSLRMRSTKTSLNKYANMIVTEDLFLERNESKTLFDWLSMLFLGTPATTA